jgi:hypothetical protein
MRPFTPAPLYNLDDLPEALKNRQKEVKAMHETVTSLQGFRVETVQYFMALYTVYIYDFSCSTLSTVIFATKSNISTPLYIIPQRSKKHLATAPIPMTNKKSKARTPRNSYWRDTSMVGMGSSTN